jgi:hypothetical protein
MACPVTVNEVLDGHVVLDLDCPDRIYLNAYVPNLQVGGQVVTFLTRHLGNPIPSPAIFDKIGTAFRKSVAVFAEDNHIPVVRFGKNDRKIEIMRPYLHAQARTGRSGVAAIGVAQEFAPVFTGTQRPTSNGIPWFAFTKKDRRVTCYYYLWDLDFGPAFIKICAYFPYPAKIWLNGHEWAKRQALMAGIRFTELSNGFAATDDPAGLQALCDRLGPGTITVFAERWWSVLPLPLTEFDRQAGYWWELSMRQVEVSRTLVFAAPRHARAFFEALVADNLDIASPRATGGHLQPAHPRPRSRRARSRPRSSPAVSMSPSTSPSTPSTSTPASSNTSKTAARYPSRPLTQRPLRPVLSTPPAQPRRAAGQGPCRQPPTVGY